MNRLKIQKGTEGYMHKKRIFEVVITIAMFAVSLSLYLAGIAATGDNKNLLTVVAVLGCLPASKSAVNMIMCLKYKGCLPETAKQLSGSCQGLLAYFDMIFTSYEKNFEISHMVVTDTAICAFTENEKCDAPACEKHLKTMLTQNGFKEVTVKVFKSLPKYKNRLEQLEKMEEHGEKAERIGALMLEIVL